MKPQGAPWDTRSWAAQGRCPRGGRTQMPMEHRGINSIHSTHFGGISGEGLGFQGQHEARTLQRAQVLAH